MISGANEEQLDIANDRADLLLKIQDLQQRIDKALTKIDNMFNNGDEYTIIDDLIELDKILKGDNNE